MKVAIIGVGLIGGSLALALKDKGIADSIIGVDENKEHQSKALSLQLVDEIKKMDEAINQSDLIVLTIPVHAIIDLLPKILDKVNKQVVMDAGSTKETILQSINDHPRRGRFVATHPMWGTEYSGPEAAVHGAFADKATVICNREESDKDALTLVEDLYRRLNM